MNVRSPVLAYRHPERSRGIFTPWRYSRIVSLLHGEAAFSLLPMEGGAPKGRRLESPRYEREYEESVLSFRHPERSRGIFFVVAVLCTYEVMIKSPRCFGCSSTDALRLIVVQGRFLASLEMTIRGKRYSHFVDFPIRKKVALGCCAFTCQRSSPLKKGRAEGGG